MAGKGFCFEWIYLLARALLQYVLTALYIYHAGITMISQTSGSRNEIVSVVRFSQRESVIELDH